MQWNSLKHGPAHFGAGRFSLLPKEVLEQGSVYRLRSVYDDGKEWNPNRQPHVVGNVRQPEFSHWKTAPSRWNRFFSYWACFYCCQSYGFFNEERAAGTGGSLNQHIRRLR